MNNTPHPTNNRNNNRTAYRDNRTMSRNNNRNQDHGKRPVASSMDTVELLLELGERFVEWYLSRSKK